MASLFETANPANWTWKEWAIIGAGLFLILLIGVAIGVARSRSKNRKEREIFAPNYGNLQQQQQQRPQQMQRRDTVYGQLMDDSTLERPPITRGPSGPYTAAVPRNPYDRDLVRPPSGEFAKMEDPYYGDFEDPRASGEYGNFDQQPSNPYGSIPGRPENPYGSIPGRQPSSRASGYGFLPAEDSAARESDMSLVSEGSE